MMADALRGLVPLQPRPLWGRETEDTIYPGLGKAVPRADRLSGAGAVFITARFRSGSTLLWNLFRNVDGVTAYYEPFNERRWFDPATRGQGMDRSHRGVTDYWREYDGLLELGKYFNESWHSRHLFMDAGFWDPDMQRYLEVLLERSKGRPVLQFNRVDFRLPWLKQHFPAARIVHLYRHPRDQWCSALMDPACFPRDGRMADFHRHDTFYLGTWARDLRYYFPFLDDDAVSHPYQIFYYLWKLSYLFGSRCADASIKYEALISQPEIEIERLLVGLDMKNYDLQRLLGLIDAPAKERWKSYADDDWFSEHEAFCETQMQQFGL
jgi:hypothetical protein